MIIKASGRSALILTAGLLLCVAGPMRATESDARASDTTKEDSAPDKPVALSKFAKHHGSKMVVVAKPRKSAKQTKNDAKVDQAKSVSKGADEVDAAGKADVGPSISASVANANAQLPADAQADAPATLAAKADTLLKGMAGQTDEASAQPAAATMQLVSADQLNDVDRAISPDSSPTATAANASRCAGDRQQ